jgi:protein-S-isoprenylcysteine O-methyltransferase Ste14
VKVLDYLFIAIWVVFWLYWLVAAVAGRRRRGGSGGLWSGQSVGLRVALALVVILGIRFHLLTGHSGDSSNPGARWICFGVFLVGLSVAVWARVHLGSNWGQPMSQRAEPELITTGPYRYVRHPIYSGLVLAMAATAAAFNFYGLLVVALVSAYFICSGVVEERNMANRFTSTYLAYKHSTKMLIPFVI